LQNDYDTKIDALSKIGYADLDAAKEKISTETLFSLYGHENEKISLDGGKAERTYNITTVEPVVYETRSTADWYNPFSWGEEEIK
jgi:hypothetical protein